MERIWQDDAHRRFRLDLETRRLDQLLNNRNELAALRYDPDELRRLTKTLSLAIEERQVDLMQHILVASEPRDPSDEKSDPPEQPLRKVDTRGLHGWGRELRRDARPLVDVNKIRVFPARLGCHEPTGARLANDDRLFHFTPLDRFNRWKSCQRISHWAPDHVKTLRLRYLPGHLKRLPWGVRLRISKLAWDPLELQRMLAKELFGHEVERDRAQKQFWPDNMVHGGY